MDQSTMRSGVTGSAPSAPEKPRYTVVVSTHQGKVRSENEDNFVINKIVRPASRQEMNMRGFDIVEPLVCGVFDGMGGEANGELASQLSADASIAVYKAVSKHTAPADEAVQAFVKESNDKIVSMLCNSKARRGGSTFVMAILSDEQVQVFSLGDSRLYLLHDGTFRQITNDHTLAMKKYRANIYTWEEAVSSPDSHKLTSFLGMDTEDQGLSPEAYPPFALCKGDKLLLCSDGLYDMCSDQEIQSVLSGASNTVSLVLVKKALENGGADNVTCIVIERTN